MSDHKDMTHRHLRHKLQSLGRRLDELEEATNKLQKSEDELLDLQDKIIQAEGSNSSLLGDVEALRKRLLKIQGKDEEVRKAEDLCRTVREKLEEEEGLTKELKGETERLQRRMAELEKLEEAFAKSKSDCGQLCLSLNEEKNLTRKLSSEMEALRARLKEVEGSEARLDRAERALAEELETLRAFAQAFAAERKRLLEKQREDETLIQRLSEEKKSREPSRIEDELFGRKSLDYLERLGVKRAEEEDNKVRELTQEVERLRSRLKQLEALKEDLKSSRLKSGELQEKLQAEQRRGRELSEQLERLRAPPGGKGAAGILENGRAEGEEAALSRATAAFRLDKPRFRSSAAPPEPDSPKHRGRELSPQQRREAKLRSKEEGSPKTARRAPRTARTAAVSSDNGVAARLPDDRSRGATSSASDGKKASVLSRYPPAANEQKPLRTPFKQMDSEMRTRSSKPVGSDSESNNSDAVAESCVSGNGVEKEAASASGQEAAASGPSRANGSYPAYRSHVAALLPADHGSDSPSSASETESTGSRPSEVEPPTETVGATASGRTAASRYPRHPRLRDAHSDGSSSRSSFDEELHGGKVPPPDSSAAAGPAHPPSALEIQRVCSPREALRSKAVIQPAIVEIDRKEVMISESSATNGKPKIYTKPMVTSSSKVTSSITIYPSEPSSSRTSSRSSSLSSEPPPARERHTSTSNILIGPSGDHRGSISVPYEISIPKSEITLRPSRDSDQDGGGDDRGDAPARSKLHNATRVESTGSYVRHQRANSRRQSSDNASADLNDPESGFESGSSTATVTSWRSQRQSDPAHDDAASDAKNVTLRNAWRSRSATPADEAGSKALTDGGSEEEPEAATTWRAYRATTFDTEDGVSRAAQRGSRTAEVYMRRFNSATSANMAEEPTLRRDRSAESPATAESGILGRTVPHAPVTSQSWSRSYSQQPPPKDNLDPAPNPCLSPASWRRHPPVGGQQHLGSSYDRLTKTTRGAEPWSGRGQGSGNRTEGRAGAGHRPWNQSEHR